MADVYCTECGAKLLPGARFCIQCGTRANGGPARSPTFSASRYAPAIVVACVLVGGAAAVLLGALAAKPPPRIPGRNTGAAASLPEGHPPIELPAELRRQIEAADAKAKQNPEDLDAWRRLGRMQYDAAQIERARFKQAAAAYDHVLEKNPEDLEALRMRGNIAFDTREPGEAISFYERYLKLSPGDRSVMTDLATMYLSAGDAERAIELYRQVLAENPEFFQAQLNLAVAYRMEGRHDEERAAVKKAMEFAPDAETRQRLAAWLAAPTPTARPTAGTEAGSGFRPDVESVFREHPMMGPKVERIDWPDENTVRVTLRGFPVDAMPENAMEMFRARISEEVKTRRQAHGHDGSLRIELFDAETGKLMKALSG